MAPQKKKPYVITTHGLLDEWAVKHSGLQKRIAEKLYERNCLERAACLHAFTETEYRSLRNYNLKNPVCVVPSGIDIATKDYSNSEAPWQKNSEPGNKVLLYLGRIHPKKGLVPLIEGWEKVKKNNSSALNWKLAIAGWNQGGHEEVLKGMVTEAGLEKSVFFLGPQFNEAKEKCYFHADAFALPSFSEGLPIVVLEAWANGLPVLITPQCNLSVGYGANAALQIEPTAESIANGLGSLFEMNAQQLGAMGANGRALVEKSFTWQQGADEIYKIYKWVLGEGEKPDSVILK